MNQEYHGPSFSRNTCASHIVNDKMGWLVKSFKEKLEEDFETYIQGVEKQMSDEFKDNVKKIIEAKLHQEADEYFDAHKTKCSII